MSNRVLCKVDGRHIINLQSHRFTLVLAYLFNQILQPDGLTSVAAMYSTSQEERATTGSFFEHHEIGAPPKHITSS
ncbi:hypothetical protein A2U01_0072716 [Trifolium medium]|uniref:Uncharacterized protein n=1 Tax=Trifolium medium TaxID=97028 RepID=A0A392SSR3_9FABA|nr:hypothetical protein [Trifolium medium]